MRFNFYTVFDVCSGVYDRPFPCHSDMEAKRLFSDIAVDAEHPIGKHPEHFTLFRIGTYENTTGELVGEPAASVCTALECVAEAQKITKGSLKEETMLKEVN